MKKSILAYGLAIILGAGVLLGSTNALQAQGAPTGTTKVAIVNVGLVFTKYQKAQFYKTELEAALKPFKDEGNAMTEKAKPYAKLLTEGKVTDPKQKDEYEKYLLTVKRSLEDLELRMKKLVGKKQEEQIVTLYKEVTGAIQGVAQAQGYQLVLGYGQQIDGDVYSVQNIERIMRGMDLGSASPLYVAPVGVDISMDVVKTLNDHYARGNPGIGNPAIGNPGIANPPVQGTTTSQKK